MLDPSELRDFITDNGDQELDVPPGAGGVLHRVTPNLPASAYTILNGYCALSILTDSTPATNLVIQLRIHGVAGGPWGELARGIPAVYVGPGVYNLPVPATAASLGQQVWLVVFLGNDGEIARRITLSWNARLVCGAPLVALLGG